VQKLQGGERLLFSFPPSPYWLLHLSTSTDSLGSPWPEHLSQRRLRLCPLPSAPHGFPLPSPSGSCLWLQLFPSAVPVSQHLPAFPPDPRDAASLPLLSRLKPQTHFEGNQSSHLFPVRSLLPISRGCKAPIPRGGGVTGPGRPPPKPPAASFPQCCLELITSSNYGPTRLLLLQPGCAGIRTAGSPCRHLRAARTSSPSAAGFISTGAIFSYFRCTEPFPSPVGAVHLPSSALCLFLPSTSGNQDKAGKVLPLPWESHACVRPCACFGWRVPSLQARSPPPAATRHMVSPCAC